jgi:hypothetical protein
MQFDDLRERRDLPLWDSVILRQLDRRLNPELRLAIHRANVDMRSSSREKKKNR